MSLSLRCCGRAFCVLAVATWRRKCTGARSGRATYRPWPTRSRHSAHYHYHNVTYSPSVTSYTLPMSRLHSPPAYRKSHIPPDYVVERVTLQRTPPEVRIRRLRNQSRVGTVPPSTSTPQWLACCARH